jgi:hypothetical protein
VDTNGGGPLRRSDPHVRVRSETGAEAPTCMHAHAYRGSRRGQAGRHASRSVPGTTAATRGQVRQQCASGQELHVCAMGPTQAKCEAEARCVRPFRWPHASKEMRSLCRFLPHAKGARQTCGSGSRRRRPDGHHVWTSRCSTLGSLLFFLQSFPSDKEEDIDDGVANDDVPLR